MLDKIKISSFSRGEIILLVIAYHILIDWLIVFICKTLSTNIYNNILGSVIIDYV